MVGAFLRRPLKGAPSGSSNRAHQDPVNKSESNMELMQGPVHVAQVFAGSLCCGPRMVNTLNPKPDS